MHHRFHQANRPTPIGQLLVVFGEDGSLTGYAGGVERKQWLLEHEATHGVRAQ